MKLEPVSNAHTWAGTIGLAVIALIMSLTVAIGAAGAGHGTYLPAKLLFPYTMLLARASGHIGLVGSALALGQFVAYGAIVRWATSRGRQPAAAVVCALMHGLAAGLALLFAAPASSP